MSHRKHRKHIYPPIRRSGGLIKQYTWHHRAVVAGLTVVGTMMMVEWIHYELLAHTLEITLPVAVDKFVFGWAEV